MPSLRIASAAPASAEKTVPIAVRCEFADKETALTELLRHLAGNWPAIERQLTAMQSSRTGGDAAEKSTISMPGGAADAGGSAGSFDTDGTDADAADADEYTSASASIFPPTLIYVSTQSEAQSVADAINSSGIRVPARPTAGSDRSKGTVGASGTARVAVPVTASAFHAGLPLRERDRVQARFMAGKLSIVVATIAFGLGVDKSDLRCVIFYGPPRSLEDFLQQSGRAGRDGRPALCHALLDAGGADVRRATGLTALDGVVDASTARELVAAVAAEAMQSFSVAPSLLLGRAWDAPAEGARTAGVSVARVTLPTDSLCQQLNVRPETVETIANYMGGFASAAAAAADFSAVSSAATVDAVSRLPAVEVVAHRAAVVEVTLTDGAGARTGGGCLTDSGAVLAVATAWGKAVDASCAAHSDASAAVSAAAPAPPAGRLNIDLAGVHPLIALIAALARARHVRRGVDGCAAVTQVPLGAGAADAPLTHVVTVTSGMRAAPWIRKDGKDRFVMRCVLADVVGAASALVGCSAATLLSGGSGSADARPSLLPYSAPRPPKTSNSDLSSSGAPSPDADMTASAGRCGGGAAAVLKDLFSLQAQGRVLVSFDVPMPFYAPPPIDRSAAARLPPRAAISVGAGASSDAGAVPGPPSGSEPALAAAAEDMRHAAALASAVASSSSSAAVQRGKEYGLELSILSIAVSKGPTPTTPFAGAAGAHTFSFGQGTGMQVPVIVLQGQQLAEWLSIRMSAASASALSRLDSVRTALLSNLATAADLADAVHPEHRGETASSEPARKPVVSSWRTLLRGTAPASPEVLNTSEVLAVHESISSCVDRYFARSIAQTNGTSPAAALDERHLTEAGADSLCLPRSPCNLVFALSTSHRLALSKDCFEAARRMLELVQEESQEVVDVFSRAAASASGGTTRPSAAAEARNAALAALPRRLTSRFVTPLSLMRVLAGHPSPRFNAQAFREVLGAGPPAESSGHRRDASVWGRYAGRDLSTLRQVATFVLRMEKDKAKTA